MGIFHRSSSSNSRFSTTFSAVSDSSSPRTSIDSDRDHLEDANSELEKTIQVQKAPILSLPIELVQQVSSYLDAESSASFCLSSRYVYYALGSDLLTEYINHSKSRFAKRRMIEAVVERAFPSHWFCAWCDKFHSWSADTTSPQNTQLVGKKRDCTDFNSYLHVGSDYILRFHHVRLALNHALYGAGIPLSTFSFTHASMAKIYRTPVPTNLSITAKIVSGHFLLHTTFAMILPSWCTSRKHILQQIWPSLPHILSGHRDSDNGHTGLMAAIDNVVRRGYRYPLTQMCSTCTTDWTVNCHFFPHATGGQTRLVLQSWRDLGDARNPFDTAWRAHGVCMHTPPSTSNPARSSSLQAGDVRRQFETIIPDHDAAAEAAKRAGSPLSSRNRIYKAFMRKDDGGKGTEVRRSRARARARPNVWRTRSENEVRERMEEEERVEGESLVAESLVRLDAERERV
jgi:hypothetical protein